MSGLFLVSDSPRRRKLARQFFGRKISFLPNGFKEPSRMPVSKEGIKRIAVGKILRSTAGMRSGTVFAADTIVIHKGKALGKPGTKKRALAMLRLIGGSKITVITAVAVTDLRSGKIMADLESTDVWMADLTDEEIRKYVDSGEPMDKAGAFAIQGKGALFVRKIHGDYYNVVGFPVRLVNSMLRAFETGPFDA